MPLRARATSHRPARAAAVAAIASFPPSASLAAPRNKAGPGVERFSMKTVDPRIVQALSAAAFHIGEAERLARDPAACTRNLHHGLKKAVEDAHRFLDSAAARVDVDADAGEVRA